MDKSSRNQWKVRGKYGTRRAPKELTEEQKAERDEREERELGGWESEGLRQTIFITLEEADSSVAMGSTTVPRCP